MINIMRQCSFGARVLVSPRNGLKVMPGSASLLFVGRASFNVWHWPQAATCSGCLSELQPEVKANSLGMITFCPDSRAVLNAGESWALRAVLLNKESDCCRRSTIKVNTLVTQSPFSDRKNPVQGDDNPEFSGSVIELVKPDQSILRFCAKVPNSSLPGKSAIIPQIEGAGLCFKNDQAFFTPGF